MAFGKIADHLAIPQSATAEYPFVEFRLIDAGPPTLKCRHAGDGNRAFTRASWKAVNAMRKSRASQQSVTDESVRESYRKDARLIADHCVVSWTNVVEDDGTVPACTPDKVYEFLCTAIDSHQGIKVYREFTMWIQDPDTFRATADLDTVAELGK